MALCSDCPPAGYPTDKTRCAECPRRLSDDPPAQIPDGFKAPLDDRSTSEMMTDRDIEAEELKYGRKIWPH
jgi:hypothetical protein